MPRYLLIFILSIMLAPIANAIPMTTFRSVGLDCGLSDNYVTDFVRDADGYIWISTSNGVNRYDGYSAAQYHVADSAGNADSNIDRIELDYSGRIWLSTLRHTYFYDRAADRIVPALSADLSRYKFPKSVKRVYVDADRNLWGIDGKRIYYYRFKDGLAQQFSLPGECSIVESRGGHTVVWLTDGSMGELSMRTGRFSPIFSVAHGHNRHARLFIDSRDRVWAFCVMNPSLRVFDMRKRIEVSIRDNYEGSTPEIMKCITEDESGNLWIGTNSSGFVVLDAQLQHAERVLRHQENPFPLPSNHINTIFVDTDADAVWVGTKKGAAYLSARALDVKVVTTPFSEDVSTFIEDAGGRMWMGYDGSGLATVEAVEAPTFADFKVPGMALPSNVVVTSYLDSRGRLWFGSYGGGIFSPTYGLQYPADRYPALSFTRFIREDDNGNMWVGSFMHGLSCIATDGKISTYTWRNSKLGTTYLDDGSLSASGDTLYVATGFGVYAVAVKSHNIKPVNYRNRAGLDYSKMTAVAILSDSRGLLWIATPNGMEVLDPKRRQSWTLTTADGISHNYARAIIEDHKGTVWFTTDGGSITRIDVLSAQGGRYKFKIKPYFSEDGLGDIEFANHSLYCRRSGEILAGGFGRYVVIDPGSGSSEPKNCAIRFSKLIIDDAVVNPADGGVYSGCLNDAKALNISTGNRIAIDLSLTDYFAAASTKYYYQVDDDARCEVDGNRLVLGDLPAGHHSITISVAGTDISRTVEVVVSTPLLQSAWFWIIVVVSIGALSFVAGKITRRRKQEEMARRGAELPQIADEDYTHFLEEAASVVDAYLADIDFGVEDFSRAMAMSRSNLYKRMMGATGLSPIEYMRNRRIEAGAKMLADRSLSISQIADNVGMSPKQFARFFKDRYGILPSQYRTR